MKKVRKKECKNNEKRKKKKKKKRKKEKIKKQRKGKQRKKRKKQKQKRKIIQRNLTEINEKNEKKKEKQHKKKLNRKINCRASFEVMHQRNIVKAVVHYINLLRIISSGTRPKLLSVSGVLKCSFITVHTGENYRYFSYFS